ncbi:MAG: peptidylprolyl isomerase [Planctomycetaceae bacterium]|nr:peptidylprolyl isomerase [Planctomycetaceae bacterium]
MGSWAFNVMRLPVGHFVRLVVLVTIGVSLRAGLPDSIFAQTYAPSPGERGDPYSPLGPQAQIQARYPLPQPQTPPPPQPQFQPPPQPIREPLPQQNGYAPSGQPLAPPGAAAPPQGNEVGFSPNEVFAPNRVIATVGSEFILYGEVSGAVEQMLAPVLPQVKTESDRQELEKIRIALTRQVLGQTINTKLMFLEFLRTIEKNAGRDKLPEVQKNIDEKMGESFEKELTAMRTQIATAKPEEIQKLMQRDAIIPRLAVLMRDNQAETLQELDAILRRYGSSLSKQIRLYGEDRLGKDTIRRQVFTKEEVSHQAMLDYYGAHADDFAVGAKARFEILTVKFANFASTQAGRNLAWNTLAQMGNEVYFGAPFSTIARKHSQDPKAQQGGQYDWTTQGSLASKEIDQAIFTLEPGKLSQIIEDERGLHIVRVIERTDAGHVPFHEAQPKIKEAIELERREADYKKFVDALRTKTQVWTVYDDVPHVARDGAGPSLR